VGVVKHGRSWRADAAFKGFERVRRTYTNQIDAENAFKFLKRLKENDRKVLDGLGGRDVSTLDNVALGFDHCIVLYQGWDHRGVAVNDAEESFFVETVSGWIEPEDELYVQTYSLAPKPCAPRPETLKEVLDALDDVVYSELEGEYHEEDEVAQREYILRIWDEDHP